LMQNENLKRKVAWAVFVASHKATTSNVSLDMFEVVDKIVHWPVFWSVYGALDGAVYRAVADAVEEDPPHAAIELYLMMVP
jgi:hypothetical protein